MKRTLRRWLVDLAVRNLPTTPRTERLCSQYFQSRVRANCGLSELSLIEMAIVREDDPERLRFFRRIFFGTMGVHYIRRFLEMGDLAAADGVASAFVSIDPQSGDEFVREEYRRYLQLAPWISEGACAAVEEV